MGLKTTHTVRAPRAMVWKWHNQPGVVSRLSAPFFPMVPRSQADNLADGTTIFGLPAGLRWEARHDLSGFVNGYKFTDVAIKSPIRALSEWRHIHSFQDTTVDGHDATLITDEVITRLPMASVAPMFAYRQEQLIQDLAFAYRLAEIAPGSVPLLDDAATPLTIAVTGSRGTVGRALVAQLQTLGHTVVSLVRPHPSRKPKPHQRVWDPDNPSPSLLDGVDALIHLAGEPIFGRFNEAHKKALYESRIPPTKKLAMLVAASSSCSVMVCASAIGFYGHNRGEEPLTESSSKGDGVLAKVVHDWELATKAASNAGKRVVNVRTGVVLSGRGGVLPLFKTLFSTGLGGKLDGGEARLSWIAIDDLTDIYIRAVVDPALDGPINATAPNPVTNGEMTEKLAKALKRPAVFPIPAIGPKILLGAQGAEELALADQNVLPEKLNLLQHTFRYNHIGQALNHELGTELLFEKRAAALPADETS